MYLEREVRDLNEIQEDLRENYVETETDAGKVFRLKQLDGYEKPESTDGLKSALRKERDNAKEANRKVKELEAKLAESGSSEEAAHLRTKLGEATARATALEAITGALGNPKLLLGPVMERLRGSVNEDGTTEVSVVSEDGTPLLDADGQPLSPEGFVKSLRDDSDYAGAFKATDKSGGGTPPATNGRYSLNGGEKKFPDRRRDFTPRQKVDYIKEHGSDKFMALPH